MAPSRLLLILRLKRPLIEFTGYGLDAAGQDIDPTLGLAQPRGAELGQPNALLKDRQGFLEREVSALEAGDNRLKLFKRLFEWYLFHLCVYPSWVCTSRTP